MDYEVEGVRPRGRPKVKWGYMKRLSDPTTMQERCYGLQEMEKVNWRRCIIATKTRHEWMNVSLVLANPGCPGNMDVKLVVNYMIMQSAYQLRCFCTHCRAAAAANLTQRATNCYKSSAAVETADHRVVTTNNFPRRTPILQGCLPSLSVDGSGPHLK